MYTTYSPRLLSRLTRGYEGKRVRNIDTFTYISSRDLVRTESSEIIQQKIVPLEISFKVMYERVYSPHAASVTRISEIT